MKKAVSAFKFLKHGHAQRLLTEGNIYIPLMQEFGDATKYQGNIYDKEGCFVITNTYENFTVAENNVYGFLKHQLPDKPIGTFFKNHKIPINILYEPAFIYCTSYLFFSDTLYFAVEEEKTNCVFITDIEKFTKILTENIDYALCVKLGYCIYIGRDINEINPDAESFTELFLADTNLGFLIKPREHAKQCELRSVWQKNDHTTNGIAASIPALTELCIDIDFSEVYEAIKLGAKLEELRVALIVNYKDGRSEHIYSMSHVNSLWSPEVRYDEHDKTVLFFNMPSIYLNAEGKTEVDLTGAYFEGDFIIDGGLSVSSSYSNSISISDIQSIEFSLSKAHAVPIWV